jgi:hypothetical protein
MTEMLDDRFDDLLRDSAREYNEPPGTPRDVMWAKIAAAREAERTGGQADRRTDGTLDPSTRRSAAGPTFFRPSARPSVRLFRWAAGIAAILAIGIGLGRLSTRHPSTAATPVEVSAETRRVNAAAYHLATTEHLSQSEAFLTLFRASVRRGGDEQLASATARQLLVTNRLLLDSPAASDGRTKLLLQDLELVLAEIAQLSPRPRSRDLDLITEGLEQGGVLSRLRTAVPAGASTTGGAL